MVAPTHLKGLQALEMAVRTGSLKSAADALSITPAAAGQRVKSLEDFLGFDLLARGRSGLSATPALMAALPHLQAAFRELEAAADTLDLHRGHEIHIAAASDFADLWLRRRLGNFRSQHPNIRFCINGEGDAPLRLGSVDCTITFDPPSESPMTDTLFRDFVLPVSSPENAQRISRLPRRRILEGFPLLHLDFYRNDPDVPSWPVWIQRNAIPRSAPERGIRFQRITATLDAVLADAGLALCGLALATQLIDESRLTLPFPAGTGSWSTHAFQARYRPEALSRPQVRRFRAWLQEESGKTRDRLSDIAGAPNAS